MGDNVRARLNSAAPSMTPTLRRIADYVMAHPDRVIYQTVTELSKVAESSEGSIIRFCREQGYSGFQEFKLKLALDLGQQPSRAAPAPSDTTQDIIARVAADSVSAVEETRSLLEPLQVDRAASLIIRARNIEIFGVGASGMTAEYLGYKLMRIGLNARTHVDPHFAAMSAAQLGPSDVAIGVSSSGSTIDTVHALHVARSTGARTIAVVNRVKSPITNHADCVLLASALESPLAGGGVASKMSQFFVLEVVFSVLRREMGAAESALRRSAEAVAEKSY